MNFLNKQTLIDAAALGGGVVAAKIVVNKVGGKIKDALPTTMSETWKDVIVNGLPIVGGVATLMIGKGNRIATGLANGMFAASFGFYVDTALSAAGVPTNGWPYRPGIGEVFMGQAGSGNQVFMGAAQDMPAYATDSYDFTSADSGELNY